MKLVLKVIFLIAPLVKIHMHRSSLCRSGFMSHPHVLCPWAQAFGAKGQRAQDMGIRQCKWVYMGVRVHDMSAIHGHNGVRYWHKGARYECKTSA